MVMCVGRCTGLGRGESHAKQTVVFCSAGFYRLVLPLACASADGLLLHHPACYIIHEPAVVAATVDTSTTTGTTATATTNIPHPIDITIS